MHRVMLATAAAVIVFASVEIAISVIRGTQSRAHGTATLETLRKIDMAKDQYALQPR